MFAGLRFCHLTGLARPRLLGVLASYLSFPLGVTVGDVLAQQARARLAEKGLDVLDPIDVKVATGDRIPTSPQMAAQIMEEAHLDASRPVHRSTALGADAGLERDESRWCDCRAGRDDGRSEDGHDTVAGTPSLPAGSALWRRTHRPSPCLCSRDGHAGDICTTRVNETQRLSVNL